MWRAAVFNFTLSHHDQKTKNFGPVLVRIKYSIAIHLALFIEDETKPLATNSKQICYQTSTDSATERLNLLASLAVFRDPNVGGVACIFVRI